MHTLKVIHTLAITGCLLAPTVTFSTPAQAQAQTPQGNIGYQVCTSYFESNKSGLKGPNSFLAFATRAAFDKVFGAAAVMGKNSFLPEDAFKSKVVVAVIKRGNTIYQYAVQGIEVVNGELNVRYKATPSGGGGGAFASPLIIAVNQNFSGTVIFVENGKRVGKAMLAGTAKATWDSAQKGHALMQAASTAAVRGHALMEAHNEKEALPLLLEAVKLNPNDGAAYLDLGIVYSRMGEEALSLKALQDSVRVQPSYNGYRNLGVVLMGMKRDAEGEAALKQAVALDPNGLAAYSSLARLYSMAGRNDEANTTFQKVVAITPAERPIDYLMRGRAYQALGQFEKAAADFDKALTLDPQNNDARDERSFASLIMGQGQEAAAGATLSLTGRQGHVSDALYPTLVGYFGSRMAGDEAGAAKFLKEAEVKGDANAWPFPVIRYLRKELTADQLLEQAHSNAEITEARTYTGLNLALDGKTEEAKPHLRWVQENGVQSFPEYLLAKGKLTQLEQTQGDAAN